MLNVDVSSCFLACENGAIDFGSKCTAYSCALGVTLQRALGNGLQKKKKASGSNIFENC